MKKINEQAQKVLIVDDDEDMRTILFCLVNSVAKAELELAKDAQQAFRKIEEAENSKKPFSLVIQIPTMLFSMMERKRSSLFLRSSSVFC